VIFAALGALGAGLQVAVDASAGAAHIDSVLAAAAVAVPAGTYLFAVARLHNRADPFVSVRTVAPVLAVLLAATGAAASIGVPAAILLMGLACAGNIGARLAIAQRAAASVPAESPVVENSVSPNPAAGT
jgi:hypothetical protein